MPQGLIRRPALGPLPHRTPYSDGQVLVPSNMSFTFQPNRSPPISRPPHIGRAAGRPRTHGTSPARAVRVGGTPADFPPSRATGGRATAPSPAPSSLPRAGRAHRPTPTDDVRQSRSISDDGGPELHVRAAPTDFAHLICTLLQPLARRPRPVRALAPHARDDIDPQQQLVLHLSTLRLILRTV